MIDIGIMIDTERSCDINSNTNVHKSIPRIYPVKYVVVVQFGQRRLKQYMIDLDKDIYIKIDI